MGSIMADVVPKHTRLVVVLSVPVLWAFFAVVFAHAEHAQRVSNVKPVHSLILAALALVVGLPITIKRFTAIRLFPLYWAIWLGAAIPVLFLLFSRVAGFGNRGDHVFYWCGLFAMTVIAIGWWRDSIKSRRQES